MNDTLHPSQKTARRWLVGTTLGAAAGLLSCAGTWAAVRLRAAGLPADLDAGETFAFNLDALLLGGKVWLISQLALAALLLIPATRRLLTSPAAQATCRVVAWAAGPLLLVALWHSLPALAVAALWIGFHALLGWFALPRQAAGAEAAARSLR